MPKLLESIDGVSCRACGAVRAPRGPYDGLCANCWRRIVYRSEKYTGTKKQHLEINRWLARKLELDLRAAAQSRMIGRCEALSQVNTYTGVHLGYQCAARAVTMRAGFKVCGRHKASPEITFVDTPSTDPYDFLSDTVKLLCRNDKRLKQAFQKALNEA